MKQDWIAKNGNDTTNMPEFEYYDFENWLLRNYYVYMTGFTQGKMIECNNIHNQRNQQIFAQFHLTWESGN